MPTPSVEASSEEIYMEFSEFAVDGTNFFPETKLIFDPPLQGDEGCPQEVGVIELNVAIS